MGRRFTTLHDKYVYEHLASRPIPDQDKDLTNSDTHTHTHTTAECTLISIDKVKRPRVENSNGHTIRRI